MRVRCGACRTQFEVAGPGRYACPVCGSVNVVRNGAQAPSSVGGYPSAPGAGGEGIAQPGAPPPPPPEKKLPKVDCPECGFNFVVGEVATAICPMCGVEVRTGVVEESDEE